MALYPEKEASQSMHMLKEANGTWEINSKNYTLEKVIKELFLCTGILKVPEVTTSGLLDVCFAWKKELEEL